MTYECLINISLNILTYGSISLDEHKDDEHTSEDGHDGHDHGEDGETDHSDDMDKDAAASTESGAATLTAGVSALFGGVALMMV